MTAPGAHRPSWRLTALSWAWQVAAHAMVPAALLLALWRARREPGYLTGLHERFGFGRVGPRGGVWVFAASLGETRAAAPLVTLLLEAGYPVTMTYASAVGRQAGARMLDNAQVTHRYVPLDLVWAMALFLGRLRPALGIVMVNELWPAQLQVARWFGVPMALVDGNITERSVRRATGLRAVRLELLRAFRLIATKGERQRDRYVAAGVEAARVVVTGELKFDLPGDPALAAAGARLRERWAGDGPVFLIASSVEDEEPALLDLIGALGEARVIWAPRNPQRFAAVGQALEARGHRVALRSRALGADLSGDPGDARVILGDSVGEMAAWYAAADLVFVGATLADHGGHSVVEPLAAGRPVVTGPSVWGIEYPVQEAAEAGAVRVLPSSDALTETVVRLLTDGGELAAFTGRAEGFAERHRGAAARTFAQLPVVGGAS